MLEELPKIPAATAVAMIEHLETLASNLRPDISNYAKGRLRFWLEWEAPLSASQPWKPGIHDERLWAWIKRRFPEVDLGLVAYGPIGIGIHRDASYAAFPAYTINLGRIEGWHYDRVYPGFKWVSGPEQLPSNPQILKPVVGSVYRFNCKNPHAALSPAEDRWVINLWSLAEKAKVGFEKFKNQASLF